MDGKSAEVRIEVGFADRLQQPRGAALFDSGGLWTLFADGDGYQFSFLRCFAGERPYKQAWFDREFTTGQVLLSREFFGAEKAVYPLEYPLDELLIIHRLARGEGVEVHGVGIVDTNGIGRLFVGHSGAGKSTTARLWQPLPGVRVLSDDRIILRRQRGEIWMYGTPWHGDAGISSPESWPLHKIYFLEQAAKNEIHEMRAPVAATELFARCFVPRHCEEGLRFALEFLEQVAHQVQCGRFGFVPNGSAVEAVRREQN